jgi:hypothetical protein
VPKHIEPNNIKACLLEDSFDSSQEEVVDVSVTQSVNITKNRFEDGNQNLGTASNIMHQSGCFVFVPLL